MIRDWHFRGSREKISLVAGVCVHRQWQIQMSHQHVRSWGFIQIQHVVVIEHQTMVHFSCASTGSQIWFVEITFILGKPQQTQIYIIRWNTLASQPLRFLLKLAKHNRASASFTDQSQDSLIFCYLGNINQRKQDKAGGVGHDSQSMPRDIFPGAHFHLNAERQTPPHADGDVEIRLIGGSFASDAERNREWHPYEMFRRPSNSCKWLLLDLQSHHFQCWTDDFRNRSFAVRRIFTVER